MLSLGTAFPRLERQRWFFTRDQWMLLMAAVNEIFLGIDIFLAHSLSGTIVTREWIPIIFGPAAGVLLLVAGLVARRNRRLAALIASVIFVLSIAVGLLGAYFHVTRAILPSGPPGQRVSVGFLIWAPPIIGPLVFSLVGLLGLSAAWSESPPNSGRLSLLAGTGLHLPYSKTRAYLFMVSLGTLATLLSSMMDHARTNFSNPWLWLPFGAGIFGVVAAATLGALDHPSRWDVLTYLAAMLLLILVGTIGMSLHILQNLTSEGLVIQERFVRGAPFLAPMLFADMGTLGILSLLPAEEE